MLVGCCQVAMSDGRLMFTSYEYQFAYEYYSSGCAVVLV